MADTLTGGHIDIIMGSYEGLLVGFHLMTSRDNTTTTATTQQLVSKFHEKSHTGSIRAITSSPNGILATGGYDEFIKLNDMKNHTEIGTLTQHEGTITCLQFFNDKYLFSSADDGIICIWDTTRWECLHILSGHRWVEH
jgi:protein MAK11